MIRFSTVDDLTALIDIAKAVGFESGELETLHNMLTDYFASNHDMGRFWLTDDDNGPVGVAYCEPERMTDGTWNLLFIAFLPTYQGQRRGTNLLRYVEDLLRARGARLLLVETLASFERTRAFYRQCGYNEEARIRDFYAVGADKIVYCKTLS